MEEQLKSVRLQDELECERKPRCRNHHLVNIELNKPIINVKLKKLPATERFEESAYEAYDQRKAQSDNGKENYDALKRSDKELYNFFTNSAHKQLKNVRHSHYFDMDESSENEGDRSVSQFSSNFNTYPSKASNRYYSHESRPALCNFCKHNRFSTRSHDENLNNAYMCGACENDPICLNCRKEICVRCKRLTCNDENPIKQPFQLKQRKFDTDQLDHMKAIEYPTKSVPDVHANNKFQQQQMQTDEDESYSDESSTERKPPYSFNIDTSSLFHPSKTTQQSKRRSSVSIRNGEACVKPDSFNELKRITDEKLSKLTKSYSETSIKINKSIESNDPHSPNDLYDADEKKHDHEKIFNSKTHNSKDVPFLRENTKRLIEFAKELERNDYNLYGRDGRNDDLLKEFKNQASAHDSISCCCESYPLCHEGEKLSKLKIYFNFDLFYI